MSTIDGIGWVAAALSSLAGLPQIMRFRRVRNANGLSLLLLELMLALNIAWLYHGIEISQPNVITANGLLFLLTLLLLVLAARSRNLLSTRLFALSVVVAVTLTTVHRLCGLTAFGGLAAAVGIASQLGQTREVLFAGNLTGLSPVFLGWMSLNQVVWLAWGVTYPDLSARGGFEDSSQHCPEKRQRGSSWHDGVGSAGLVWRTSTGS